MTLLVQQENLALGVDVGGTHLRVALVTPQGSIVRSVRQQLVERSPEEILDQLERGVEALKPPPGALPLGIGLAAQIWTSTGTVAVAPNLGWRNVPFGAMLRARFGPHVRMVNDLNAIAVGEARYGSGAGTADLVCIFVGTGVGMGAVCAGHVLEGANGLATELGHIKVASPLTGRLCGCGERGCLEAYTSGRYLPELFAEKIQAGLQSPLWDAHGGDLKGIDAEALDRAYSQGDAAAIALWEDVSTHLARAVGDVVTLFNPRVVVWGGGVLAWAPALKARVVELLPLYAARPAMAQVQLKATTLGDESGVLGAACLAWEAYAAAVSPR